MNVEPVLPGPAFGDARGRVPGGAGAAQSDSTGPRRAAATGLACRANEGRRRGARDARAATRAGQFGIRRWVSSASLPTAISSALSGRAAAAPRTGVAAARVPKQSCHEARTGVSELPLPWEGAVRRAPCRTALVRPERNSRTSRPRRPRWSRCIVSASEGERIAHSRIPCASGHLVAPNARAVAARPHVNPIFV
jgi:hypothetical protein